MDSFEIIAKEDIYKIIHHSDSDDTFVVFNHATCHVIKRNTSGNWEAVGHRFGTAYVPVKEIGAAIDEYFSMQS
ncbi:MAG TPA: hypothetical protein VGN20_14595 [Mucilaginibacter sp.]|jgi:hypothetical protein